MKVLLFGKNGQLGWELQRSLQPLGEVIAVDFDSEALSGDFTQPETLAATVRTVRPDLIVNAAAHTAVDKAETEPEIARLINAAAPAVLAAEAAASGAWLVHYSTDYVFDGSGSQPRDESAPTRPLNVYGQSKLEGEIAVAQGCPRHLIFRTSWVYAARGGNFAKTMVRLAGERERLTVVDDQFGAPTGADLLADVTVHALRTLRDRGDAERLAGLYHLTAGGVTNWHGYAQFVVETARRLCGPLKCTGVDPVPSSAFPTPARRPLNSRLDCHKLKDTFLLNLPEWQLGVERMLHEIL